MAYFLPLNAGAVLHNKPTGMTQIEYGGWASPYTDNYATDPALHDEHRRKAWPTGARRARRIRRVHVDVNEHESGYFSRTDAWYNTATRSRPKEPTLDVDGHYRFSHVPQRDRTTGCMLRDRYISEPSPTRSAAPPLRAVRRIDDRLGAFGGLPLFKYNRVQLEYDF